MQHLCCRALQSAATSACELTGRDPSAQFRQVITSDDETKNLARLSSHLSSGRDLRPAVTDESQECTAEDWCVKSVSVSHGDTCGLKQRRMVTFALRGAAVTMAIVANLTTNSIFAVHPDFP